MVAWATSAPATSWCERLGLTPSSSARSAADIREMNAMSWRNPGSVSTRRTRGPAEDGAAPLSRASERNVFEVATTRSGSPCLATFLATDASSSASHSRVGGHLLAARRVAAEPLPGQPPGAERHRPREVGLLVDAHRDLQRAAADVEHEQLAGRPAVPAAGGEEGEPGLVGAGQHLQLDAGLVVHAAEHLGDVVGVADRGGRERHQVLATQLRGGLLRLRDGVDQVVGALRGELAVRGDPLGEAQHGLLRAGRHRVRAPMRIHDEQVDGVGTDV